MSEVVIGVIIAAATVVAIAIGQVNRLKRRELRHRLERLEESRAALDASTPNGQAQAERLQERINAINETIDRLEPDSVDAALARLSDHIARARRRKG